MGSIRFKLTSRSIHIFILMNCSVFSKISSISNHMLEMQHTSLDYLVKLKERDLPNLKSSHRYQIAKNNLSTYALNKKSVSALKQKM